MGMKAEDIMRISMVAARSLNNVIGRDNDLPWRAKEDVKFFKEQTLGKPLIMGRKTFESLDNTFGRPLPGRANIVITRDESYDYDHPDVYVTNTLDDALAIAREIAERDAVDEICIGGGAEIYRLAMPVADRMYLTDIHAEIEGDTFYPEFDESEWTRVAEKFFEAAPGDTADFTIVTWDRAA